VYQKWFAQKQFGPNDGAAWPEPRVIRDRAVITEDKKLAGAKLVRRLHAEGPTRRVG
jgi:hypothetical protein